MRKCAITTFDNPFNPLNEFSQWFMYDNDRGYGSCQYLARIVRLTDSMTREEACEETERAIDEIIAHDPFNIYTKVVEEVDEDNDEEESFIPFD